MTHSDSYNICTSDEKDVILYSCFIFSREAFSRIRFPLCVYYIKLLLCRINVIFLLLFKYLYDFKFPTAYRTNIKKQSVRTRGHRCWMENRLQPIVTQLKYWTLPTVLRYRGIVEIDFDVTPFNRNLFAITDSPLVKRKIKKLQRESRAGRREKFNTQIDKQNRSNSLLASYTEMFLKLVSIIGEVGRWEKQIPSDVRKFYVINDLANWLTLLGSNVSLDREHFFIKFNDRENILHECALEFNYLAA